jgi:hypothetical protein
MAEYGLNKPKLRLKLSGPDAPPEIWFGKEAALEGKMYVRFENSKEAYLVSQSVKKAIDKKPEEFRDRKLTDLNAADIHRVVLKTKAGELEVEKKGEHWGIVKPLRARADDQKVNDLIAQVTAARIEQFVANDEGDLHPYGLAEPRGSVTLFSNSEKSGAPAESSNGKQGQTLQIGNPAAPGEKETEQVYVRFTARGFVYTLPKKIEEILNTTPNDLRDRHLVRIDTNILDRLTIEAPGKTRTVLARKGEDWTIASLENKGANSAEVRRLIDKLQSEQVTRFAADVASDLAKYGLDKPQLRIVFSSFASENTPETKAGDQPFGTVAFGKTENEEVFARVDDEPFIVAVKSALLDQIYADPLRWQDLTIFKFKPDQIYRLSVLSDKDLRLERGEDNQWNWLMGEGEINQTNVRSLVNTLINLRAVRWVGATNPEQGFVKPQLVITFTTEPEDKGAYKLTVGGPTEDGMWHARVSDREGTFVISNPDFSALKLSLVAQPSPAPTPTTGATTTPAAAPK